MLSNELLVVEDSSSKLLTGRGGIFDRFDSSFLSVAVYTTGAFRNVKACQVNGTGSQSWCRLLPATPWAKQLFQSLL